MKKILYFYLLFFLIGTASCYRDLGNYDYNRLPELKVEGILGDYGTKLLYKDSLIIEPHITFGDEDESSFDAVWYELQDTLKTISRGMDLRILPNRSGLIEFFFEARHRELGIAYRTQTKVIVSSGMERGIYILKETPDGNTEVDGHIRKDVDVWDLYPDMLSKQIGRPMEGKPVALDYWDWKRPDAASGELNNERVLRPASEKELAVFRMNDFSYVGGIPELFFDLNPGDLQIESLKSVNGTTLIIYNNGRVRTLPNDQEASHFFMEFSGNYKLNPQICAALRGAVFVYDELTSSFKSLSGTVTTLRNQGDFAGYNRVRPMNNLDADLRFFGRIMGRHEMFDPGTGYALLSKKNNPDSLLLFHIGLRNLAGHMDSPNISSVSWIDTLASPMNMKQGKMFAMHETEKLIFYSLDNKIFSYNILTKQENLVIGENDYPAGKVPDEITYLKYAKCLYDMDKYDMDRLFVGGYRNGSYVLYAYTVQGGRINGEPLVFEGEGRIKDIRYTTPYGKIKEFYIWQ